jgi:hypothetical protein
MRHTSIREALAFGHPPPARRGGAFRCPYSGRGTPDTASLVQVALFAAAPYSAWQAHSGATSNRMAHFWGVAGVVREKALRIILGRTDTQHGTPKATPIRLGFGIGLFFGTAGLFASIA